MSVRPRLARVGVLVFPLVWGLAVHGQEGGPDRSTRISLNSGVIDIRKSPDDPPRGDRVLVKYPGPVTAGQVRALAAAAQRIYTYLPYDTYLVKLPAAHRSRKAMSALGASWIGPYRPRYKISRAAAAAGTSADALEIVIVHVFPDADLDRVIGSLRELRVERIAGTGKGGFFSRIRLLLTPAEIARYRAEVARIPDVFWIDVEPRRVLLNDTTVWVGQSGLDGGGLTPIFDRGIFGTGQIVGVLDTGIDPDMCYFRDAVLGLPPWNACNGGTVISLDQRKVMAVDFLWDTECSGGIGATEWDTHDHGTHVAGTVAGDDLANPLTHDPGDGMAPGARLVIQDGGLEADDCADLPGIGCPVVDLKPIFQQAYSQGARIHTNSWGDQENSPIQNNYTTASQDADEFMWNHKDCLLFFAAGNSGPGSGSVSSPSTAKSVVSVGATQRGTNADYMASFSSCGPTDDGRIKPEVTIPGYGILSANNDGNATSENCGTRSMSGTSMATPAAAGLAALIRQYYAGGWYPTGAATAADGFGPSAALLRASLVSSAREMAGSTSIPSDCQGWGRVLLDDVLYFAGDARRLWILDDTSGFALGSAGESRDFFCMVGSSAEPLKVTLAWTDFPSTPAAGPHLNNDLDLILSGPDGTFLGNVFALGTSTAGGGADRVNTLEQVLVPEPSPGVVTVTVRSFNVPDGPQPFALVVTGDITETCSPGLIFSDGFESGTVGAWSSGVVRFPTNTTSGKGRDFT